MVMSQVTLSDVREFSDRETVSRLGNKQHVILQMGTTMVNKVQYIEL